MPRTPCFSIQKVAVAAAKMNLEFRETRLADIRSLSNVPAAADENSSSRALLLRLGIRLPPTDADLLSERLKLWECADDSVVVGHCAGDCATGEILSLSVRSGYEGRGIGRRLLCLIVAWLRASGAQRIWLVAPSDPTLRAFGFYRALGWRPSGEQLGEGNEVLELSPNDAT